MSDPNPNQLSIESQSESIDRAQTNVEFAPASADRKSDEQRSRIYLLFEREQFDKYEHWLRLGLIYPAHPNDADEHGKFEGLSEELGSLPFSTQIIDFDILVEVLLTPQELDLANSCSTESMVGWYSPGIIPCTRIQSVLFQSHALLESCQKDLKNGAIVPDVLSKYMAKWAVIDKSDTNIDQKSALETLIAPKCKPEKREIAPLLHRWESRYGQFSFLRSLFSAMPDLPITSNIMSQLTSVLGETWSELQTIKKDISHEIPWEPKQFYALFKVHEAIKAYADGDDSSSERIHALANRADQFSQNLAILLKEADCWWGEAKSENQPLTASFKAIQNWIERDQLDGPVLSEALIALTYNARRLNLNDNRDQTGRARTTNFSWQDRSIYMTSPPEDGMNVIIAECCYSLILDCEFDVVHWLAETGLSKEDVICLDDERLTLFGMNFGRVKHPHSLRILSERMMEQQKELDRISDDFKRGQEEIERLNQKLKAMEKRISKSDDLSRQIADLAKKQQEL